MMTLELYHLDECPYSAKVRKYLYESGLREQVNFHELEKEPGARARLEAISGSQQVPCLIADGRPIQESDTIIAFLREQAPSSMAS